MDLTDTSSWGEIDRPWRACCALRARRKPWTYTGLFNRRRISGLREGMSCPSCGTNPACVCSPRIQRNCALPVLTFRSPAGRVLYHKDRRRGRNSDSDNQRNGNTHIPVPFGSFHTRRTFVDGLFSREMASPAFCLMANHVSPRGTSALRGAQHAFPASRALDMAYSLGTPPI
jgi:hypothetical protein